MDVKTLCLGVLCLGEASGYEIKKHFEDAFRHFYPASFGSIYPALRRLTDTGLVTCTVVAQEGRPDKKVYRITAAGRAVFLEALTEAEPAHRVRSEFLVQMYFAELFTPAGLDAVMARRAADLRTQLGVLDALAAGGEFGGGPGFTLGYGRTVLRAGLEYIEAQRLALKNELQRKTS